MRSHRFVALPLLAGLVLLARCGGGEPGGPPPGTPERAALDLFELARVDEPTPEQLEALFGPEIASEPPPSLLDAIGALSEIPAPSIVEVLPLAGLERTAVDLVADLQGHGAARFSVQLQATSVQLWHVSWFQGPGVEWPPPRSRGGDRLTVSASPGGPGDPG